MIRAEFITIDTELATAGDLAAPAPVFIGSAIEQASLNAARLAPNIDYYANRNTLVTFPLPVVAAPGDKFYLRGIGTGLWRLTQNAGQVIHGATDTTIGTGGYIQSQHRYDTLAVVCVANNSFLIFGGKGSLTIV